MPHITDTGAICEFVRAVKGGIQINTKKGGCAFGTAALLFIIP